MKTGAPYIIAVGGGKGGVGKSLIAASMGLALSEAGNTVAVVDVDLGGSNLHTLMGITPEDDSATITRYFRRKDITLSQLFRHTPVRNLFVLCGSLHNYRLVNLPYYAKLRFFRELGREKIDFVILDLGAGSAYTTLDFFALSHAGLMVTTLEKTAIENTYRFLKGALLRKLRFAVQKEGKEVVDEVLHSTNLKSPPGIKDILRTIYTLNPESGERLSQMLATTRVGIILNMMENISEISRGVQMEKAITMYLKVDACFLGGIRYYEALRKGMKKGETILRLWEVMDFREEVKKIVRNFLRWSEGR